MPTSDSQPRLLDSRVVLDACVLFPVWCCDVLLTAQEVGIIRTVIASPEIIDEARRNALARYPDKAEGVERRFKAVRRFVEGGSDPLPEVLVDDIETINAKDRHVVRAAIHHEADFVITADNAFHTELNGWATSTARSNRLWGALTTDAFVNAASLESPAKLALLLRTMASKRRHPPMADVDLLDNLRSRFPSLDTFELPPPT